MRIAISGNDGFIAPYLLDLLGPDAGLVPDEAMNDPRTLDATLASAEVLIHFHGHPPEEMERDDRGIPRLREDVSRRIVDAKKRHQGLYMILVGSLRVHPEADDDGFHGKSTLSPRDATAEAQLWLEERALDNATEDSPISILRLGNVHGMPLEGGKGRGYLHDFAGQALVGWVSVPGDGSGMKDIIHVKDVCLIIAEIAHNPPPTREALAVGNGWRFPISELAETVAAQMGAEVQLWADERDELWGTVEAQHLQERIEYQPMVGIEEILGEAINNASF